jgi:hypothetical protein
MVWLHFDAKYRVEQLAELWGEGGATAGGAVRDDLVKMHAYRDAIARSAGAYVLYPGSEAEAYRAYHEILPGLGAFALQPAEDGVARGRLPLVRFLDDVFTHLASQLSQHERARYWAEVAHAPMPLGAAPASSALARPPADTRVLVGWVKGPEHWAWIQRQGRYNLRADERTGSVPLDAAELSAEFLLLWGEGLAQPVAFALQGAPALATREELLERGYPKPRGRLYVCLELGRRLGPGEGPALAPGRLEALAAGRPKGAPFAASWAELVAP